MKRYIPLLGLFFVLFAVFACQDQSQTPDSVVGPLMETVGTDLELTANPYPAEVPPATVEPLEFTMSTIRNFDPEGTITPSSAYAVLPPGGTFDELKEVYLPPGILPEIADIIFAMDLTGSMGGELSNVKMNSVNIMNVLAGAIDDPQFGVMSHMDYNGTFGGCGYTATYGGGTDYPYSLDQGLTTATADVASARGRIKGCVKREATYLSAGEVEV